MIKFDEVTFKENPVFGMMIPKNCAGDPSEILNPRGTWNDKSEYDKKAKELAAKFVENFKKFRGHATEEILKSAPLIN